MTSALSPGPVDPAPADADVVIVGAGAAGLATAIFLLERAPGCRVLLLDGASKPGAKILISGGARCNVTNARVTETDFNGGRPAIIRNILKAFPVPATVEFFRRIGVGLHEEPGGKLFPDSNRSRDVLNALLTEVGRLGGLLQTGSRVLDVSREAGRCRVETAGGAITARAVVLATGGLSLPKTGSDGSGYAIARRFGHTLVATTPALVPLLLADDRTSQAAADSMPGPPERAAGADDRAPGGSEQAFHQALSGVSHEVRLDLRLEDVVTQRVRGAMLWTHFGASGPAVLDVSRHWLRARLDDGRAQLTVSLFPDETFDALEARWVAMTRVQPRTSLQAVLAAGMPASLAAAVLRELGLPPDARLATLTRDHRRRLIRATLEWPLTTSGSRGYNFAEATAGGVDLREVDPSSMASRLCDRLYLVGEVLDVDGRIGGFNFQWAWATARVAGEALARLMTKGRGDTEAPR